MHSQLWIFNVLFYILSFLSSWSEGKPTKKLKGLQWPAFYDFDYDNADSDSEESYQPKRVPLSHPSAVLGKLGEASRQQLPPMTLAITKENIVAWSNSLKQDMDQRIRDLSLKQTYINSPHGMHLARYITDFIKNAYNYLMNLYQNVANNKDYLEIDKLINMYDQEKRTYISLKDMIALFYSILSIPNTATPASTDLKNHEEKAYQQPAIAWSYYDDNL